MNAQIAEHTTDLPGWAVNQYPAAPIPFLACASRKWADEIERAKDMDRRNVAELSQFGHVDACHQLCNVQREQHQNGYVAIRVSRNIYGWCVRDTMNDGRGNMSGNGSAQFAAEWAVNYWLARKDNCDVFLMPPSADELEIVTAIEVVLANVA